MVTVRKSWNPSNELERQLKAALDKMAESASSVLFSPSETAENREREKLFLLQGKSYFALRAYVMTGKTFPADSNAFDKQISKDCFKRLSGIDPDIYQQTKDGFISVGSTCKPFYDTQLHKIVHAGTLAVTWSQKTLGYLTQSKRLNLHSQLMILSDLKYVKLEDRDDDFKNALSGARILLDFLQKEAEDHKLAAQNLVTSLLKFRDDTQEILPKIQHLIKQYSTGPATNAKNQTTPYLEFLNEDYQKAVDLMKATLDKYNDKHEQWMVVTGVAIGVGVSIGWIPIFGWVPLCFTVAQAVQLRKVWEKLEGECAVLRRENEEERQLIDWLNIMVVQFKDLDKKMDDAIGAVSVLSTMFEEQGRAYEMIRTSLENLNYFASNEDSTNRSFYISYKIEETSDLLQGLQRAAAGFVKAILTEDKTLDKEVCFGVDHGNHVALL